MDDDVKARRAIIEGLRQLATWLEECPEAGVPPTVKVTDYPWRKDQLSYLARLPGPWRKVHDGDLFYLAKSFGSGVEYRAMTLRSTVCRRVVTGTAEVVVPAEPAKPEVRKTVDVVEWRCDEPLLATEKGE